MARKKEEITEQDENLFKKLAKNIGGDILDELDKCPGFIDTGILSVNYIISERFVGGGFPVGTLAEVMGDSSTGKSLLGTNFLRGCQTANGIAVFHDAERAINKDFAIKASHVDASQLLVTECPTLQSSFNKIHKIIRNVRDVAKIQKNKWLGIVYDSIAVSPSEREYVETTVDLEEVSKEALKEAGGGAEKPGERARICSGELRKLMPVVKEHNVTILFVNQLRKKIGVIFGDDRTPAGGGEALKYYCSTRLFMTASKQLKNGLGKVIGMKVSFKNIKSRFTSPFQEAKAVRLYYENGIDPFGGLLELMLQLGRIESTGRGIYKINDPWANGKEKKFKSAKEDNTIPVDILMEFPKLVDAETPEQIQYYVDMFGMANEAIKDVAEEGEITSEDL